MIVVEPPRDPEPTHKAIAHSLTLAKRHLKAGAWERAIPELVQTIHNCQAMIEHTQRVEEALPVLATSGEQTHD